MALAGTSTSGVAETLHTGGPGAAVVPPDGAFPADRDMGSFHAVRFTAAEGGMIRAIAFEGVYSAGERPPEDDNFSVVLFADGPSSTTPGLALSGALKLDVANRIDTGVMESGRKVYHYEANFPTNCYSVATGNPYWLSISNDTSFDSASGWEWTAAPGDGQATAVSSGSQVEGFDAQGSANLVYSLESEAFSYPVDGLVIVRPIVTEDGRVILKWRAKPWESFYVERSVDSKSWDCYTGPVYASGSRVRVIDAVPPVGSAFYRVRKSQWGVVNPNDYDGDGVPNGCETDPFYPIGNASVQRDEPGDATDVREFQCSADFDGDGIPNEIDEFPYRPWIDPNDYDGDGVPNDVDEDPYDPTNTNRIGGGE
ncbi:MAG: thrombospondin type 3 repeat-containing protein [Verrucomicrobiales bacterium]